MKPIIGITMTKSSNAFSVNSPYVQSVLNAGGVPLCIPLGVEKLSNDLFNVLDGILFSGGVDVHPHFFQEEPHPKLGEIMLERDQFEISLIHEALNKGIPIFAICRGIQILNVALGGTLYQDIYSQRENVILHSQKADRSVATHFISIVKDSKLFKIIGKERVAVNSIHHQSIKDVGTHLKVVARTSDGIIEAAEIDETVHPFCLAVQWHPEEMVVDGDEFSKKLFSRFVAEALVFKSNKKGRSKMR